MQSRVAMNAAPSETMTKAQVGGLLILNANRSDDDSALSEGRASVGASGNHC